MKDSCLVWDSATGVWWWWDGKSYSLKWDAKAEIWVDAEEGEPKPIEAIEEAPAAP